MCGLFGYIDLQNSSLDEKAIERAREALNTLTHRGPDQWSESVQGPVYMGHRRLSILDLSESGRQPMRDGDVTITVNGEIYNFQPLRKELREDRFKSSSDSEVVLHGYREWGIHKLLEKIDGMYAFTVFDAKNGELHLVRDRAGIKPLYYAHIDNKLVWASELKAIEKFFDGQGVLKTDNTALYDFLTYRYIPAPKTMYQNVFKLEAGHILTVNLDSKQSSPRRYWVLEPSNNTHSVAENCEQLRALIGKSVKEQMVSDVPIGFFLSGGLDSSVVVAEAVQHATNPATFSIGFDHKAHDETHYAEMVAKHCATNQRTEIISVDDALDLPTQMRRWYDEPFADNSALPSYYVSKFAKQHSTVVLTGDGGDELFGGYRWYKRFPAFQKAQAPVVSIFQKGPCLSWARGQSGVLRKVLERVDLFTHFDPLALYAALVGGAPTQSRKAYAEYLEIPQDYDPYWSFRRYWREDLPTRKRLQYLDFHTFLPEDIFTKVDRVSMAVSLEARVPLLSREIIEFAFSLPESFLYLNGQLKGGFKEAYRDALPPDIIDRPKKGFSVPMHIWGKKTLEGDNSFEEEVFAHFKKAGVI